MNCSFLYENFIFSPFCNLYDCSKVQKIKYHIFNRPFKHIYPNNGGSEIIEYTDRYYQSLLQIPFKLRYNFSEKWKLLLEVLPQFNFYTAANDSRSLNGNNNFSWWGFHFYAIEVNPGIEYSVDRFNFGLKFRAFQFKKIDPILFWSTSNFVIEDTYEVYNPFKIYLSIGYNF